MQVGRKKKRKEQNRQKQLCKTCSLRSRKECAMMAIVIIMMSFAQLQVAASNYCRKIHGTSQHTEGVF